MVFDLTVQGSLFILLNDPLAMLQQLEISTLGFGM